MGIDLAVTPPEAPGDAQHAGDAEAPDVGVEDAYGKPALRQCDGEVDGHRRLAHPALPTGDGQDPGRGRHLGGLGPLAGLPPGSLHGVRLLGLGHLPVGDAHRADTGKWPDLGFHVALDLAAQGAPRGGERDGDGNAPVVADADLVDHAQLHDAGVKLRIDHGRERAADLVHGRWGAGAGGIRHIGSIATLGHRGGCRGSLPWVHGGPSGEPTG